MNTDILAGKWNQIKGHVKSEFSNLTDQDLEKIKGEKGKFLGLLQEKYGYTVDIAEEKLKQFTNKLARELDIDTDELSAHCRKYVCNLEDRIKKNPVQATMISFAVGVLVDRILRGLFSSK